MRIPEEDLSLDDDAEENLISSKKATIGSSNHSQEKVTIEF
jgi:hypothetical protein